MPIGLLGTHPTRKFKVFREEWPAIFRFNGVLYQEFYDIDTMEDLWVEIAEEDAEIWLGGAEFEPSAGLHVVKDSDG